MCNGVITLGMLIVALSWLSGCARRVTETAQNRQLNIDTVYHAEKYETTRNDTFARLVYVFRDTIRGGTGYYEKIISNTTTKRDTVYIQAKKHDDQQTATKDVKDKGKKVFLSYIGLFVLSLLFVCVIFVVLVKH